MTWGEINPFDSISMEVSPCPSCGIIARKFSITSFMWTTNGGIFLLFPYSMLLEFLYIPIFDFVSFCRMCNFYRLLTNFAFFCRMCNFWRLLTNFVFFCRMCICDITYVICRMCNFLHAKSASGLHAQCNLNKCEVQPKRVNETCTDFTCSACTSHFS